MNNKHEDWQRCKRLWQDHMLIEAANIGYDFKAGAAAHKAYCDARAAYEETHGERFSPYAKESLNDNEQPAA